VRGAAARAKRQRQQALADDVPLDPEVPDQEYDILGRLTSASRTPGKISQAQRMARRRARN